MPARISRCFFLPLAVLLFASNAGAAIPAAERQALIDLYGSTNGAGWTSATNWNGPAGTECTWYGVVCDGEGDHVAEIHLQNNNLTGSLPDLSPLSALQVFAVYSNGLHGPIPKLGALTALTEFDVADNELTGSIPALDGLASLQRFIVYRNHLTGTLPSMSGLASLLAVDAGRNALTDSIDAGVFPPNLVGVYLDGNAFGGPVPAAPAALQAHGSRLCPNLFAPAGSPESASDTAWDVATNGSAGDLWSAGCPTTATTTTITALTPASATVGSSIGVSFSVAGAIVPAVSGTVSVHDDADRTVFCSTGTLSAGAGSCDLTFATPGPHSLTAVYQPDNASYAAYAPSSVSYSLFVDAHAAGSRCYVNAAAAGGNDGNSWASAYVDLQWALLDPGCSEVWVAQGVYKPASTTDQTIYFDIHPGVAVYGGFTGNETSLSDRVLTANHLSVLSGDLDNDDAHAGDDQIDRSYADIAGNNSWHIVVMDATTELGPIGPGTVLDGFTVTGGGVTTQSGGGLFCAGRQAAATCNPTLANLVFSGNLADTGGAIMMVGDASPTVSNTTFRGNHAKWGGAVFLQTNDNAHPTFVDVTFSGNSAVVSGGAIDNSAGDGGISSVYLVNATFNGNSALFGGAIDNFSFGSSGTVGLRVANTILWGNTASSGPEIVLGTSSANFTFSAHFRHSIVQGSGGSANWNGAFGTDDGDNLDADPGLGPLQDNGGWTPTLLPQAGSAAIDTGGDTCTSADQRGVTAPQGVHCDIGAVEVKQAKLSVVASDHGSVSESAPSAALGGDITHCTSAGGYGCFAFYPVEPDARAVGLALTPDSGYAIAGTATSGCDGGLSGNVYTTAALAGDCQVDVTFAQSAPPVANPTSGFVEAGGTVDITLSGSDTNPGGPYTLAYAIATPPAHGSVSLSSHTAVYTAEYGYVGDDSFTFTVSDANGTSVAALVTVAVHANATTTTLTASPNPAAVNQPVTMRVVISAADSAPTVRTPGVAEAVPAATAPSGSAVVTDGTLGCTATISNGSGSCLLAFATPGTRALTATFTSSGPAYAASSGTAQLVVTAAGGSTPAAAPTLSPGMQGLLAALILLLSIRFGMRSPRLH